MEELNKPNVSYLPVPYAIFVEKGIDLGRWLVEGGSPLTLRVKSLQQVRDTKQDIPT